MEQKTTTPAAINIDAQLVLVFNNYSDMSDKELIKVKQALLKKTEEQPELAEPIQSIIDMLGL